MKQDLYRLAGQQGKVVQNLFLEEIIKVAYDDDVGKVTIVNGNVGM